MNFQKNFKYFFLLPVALVVLSLVAIAVWGLKPGLDLQGGSLLQVSYSQSRPDANLVRGVTSNLGLGEIRIQPTGTNSYTLRARTLSNDEKNNLETALGKLGQMKEGQFTSIGPTIGSELLNKAMIAIVLVVFCIIVFISFAFRHVSKPVASWKYGVVAIITLAHDILIPAGLFALLGHFVGAEIDALFIVALLTILGISINDTIVVFDRIRENLRKNEETRRSEEYASVIGRSIMQTLVRSINTSLTVVIVLAALYFVGPAATHDFALTLIVGMIAGTYSSIFLAAPLLVVWQQWQKKV